MSFDGLGEAKGSAVTHRFPLPHNPRSLKVRSIMNLRRESRRPGRAVFNNPDVFKEMLDQLYGW